MCPTGERLRSVREGAKVPRRGPNGARIVTDGQQAPRSKKSLWSEPQFLLIGVVILAMALAEGTATDWLPLVTVDGHGLHPALGSTVYAMFAAAMAVGRFAGFFDDPPTLSWGTNTSNALPEREPTNMRLDPLVRPPRLAPNGSRAAVGKGAATGHYPTPDDVPNVRVAFDLRQLLQACAACRASRSTSSS